MTKSKLLFALAAAACLGTVSHADAAIVSTGGGGKTGPDIIWDATADGQVKLCFELATQFTDNGGASDNTDYQADSGKSTGTFIARGLRFRLTNTTLGLTRYYYASATTGCINVDVDTDSRYTIRLQSKARMTHGNTIVVRNNDTANSVFGYTATSNLRPSIGNTYTYTWPATQTGYTSFVSNVLAGATFSHYRRHGVWDETLTLFLQRKSNCTNSCYSSSNESVYLDNGGRQRKFTIAHELGHMIVHMRDERQTNSNATDYDLTAGTFPVLGKTFDVSTCATGGPGHSLTSEEWAVASANEGFAEYYGATVWNASTQDDCWYRSTSCMSTSTSRADIDFQCYGPEGIDHFARSTVELDWVRFLWDARSECDISFSRILSLWDAANPHDWSHSNAQGRLLAAAVFALTPGEYGCFRDTMVWNGALPDYVDFGDL